jgi:predicted nucleotidyltransferase
MNKDIYTIDEIKEKLHHIFEAEPIFTALLFGSYASGEATTDSDIDIVIDSHRQLLNMNFYGVLNDMSELLGKKVDLIEAAEIKDDSFLFEEINAKGVLLYERKG